MPTTRNLGADQLKSTLGLSTSENPGTLLDQYPLYPRASTLYTRAHANSVLDCTAAVPCGAGGGPSQLDFGFAFCFSDIFSSFFLWKRTALCIESVCAVTSHSGSRERSHMASS